MMATRSVGFMADTRMCPIEHTGENVSVSVCVCFRITAARPFFEWCVILFILNHAHRRSGTQYVPLHFPAQRWKLRCGVCNISLMLIYRVYWWTSGTKGQPERQLDARNRPDCPGGVQGGTFRSQRVFTSLFVYLMVPCPPTVWFGLACTRTTIDRQKRTSDKSFADSCNNAAVDLHLYPPPPLSIDLGWIVCVSLCIGKRGNHRFVVAEDRDWMGRVRFAYDFKPPKWLYCTAVRTKKITADYIDAFQAGL